MKRSRYDMYLTVKRLTILLIPLYVISFLLFAFDIPYYQIAIVPIIAAIIGCIAQYNITIILERDIVICKSKIFNMVANNKRVYTDGEIRVMFNYNKKKHIEHNIIIWPQFILNFLFTIFYIWHGLDIEQISGSVFTIMITVILFSTFIVNMCLTFRSSGTNEFIMIIVNEYCGDKKK